jgi:hypothetical protein
MRRKHSQEIFGKSFDSFLGVVTKNGLGMLILVAMASTFTSEQTLSQTKFKKDLGTPLVQPSPPGRKVVDYECVGNRVLPFEIDSVEADINAIFGLGDVVLPRKVQELCARQKSTEHHIFHFAPIFNGVKLIARPHDKDVGFTLAGIKTPAFANHLEKLDPAKRYLYFHVRPDSFEVFREARDLARAKGFQVGWEPLSAEKELSVIFAVGPGAQPNID